MIKHLDNNILIDQKHNDEMYRSVKIIENTMNIKNLIRECMVM